MTVTIGWWALPLWISIGVFFWWASHEPEKGGYVSVDGDGMVKLIAGLFLIMLSWLIYFIIF